MVGLCCVWAAVERLIRLVIVILSAVDGTKQRSFAVAVAVAR